MKQAPSVVIIGAGAAGLSCALSAAAHGAKVVLVEKTARLGGTVKQALLHTLGGLFDDQGEWLNPGLPVELGERLSRACPRTQKRRIGKTWVLNVDPEVYAQVVADWIEATPAIEFSHCASIARVAVYAGRVEQLSVTCEGKTHVLWPDALVDATGDAGIVRRIDARLVDDGLALGGFIVQLRGVYPEALRFPKSVALLREIRKAVETGDLAPECSTVWLDTGVYADEAYAKFSVDPLRLRRRTNAANRARVAGIYAWFTRL